MLFRSNSGCSQLGDDHRMTQKLLAAIAKHPNAGGEMCIRDSSCLEYLYEEDFALRTERDGVFYWEAP